MKSFQLNILMQIVLLVTFLFLLTCYYFIHNRDLQRQIRDQVHEEQMMEENVYAALDILFRIKMKTSQLKRLANHERKRDTNYDS